MKTRKRKLQEIDLTEALTPCKYIKHAPIEQQVADLIDSAHKHRILKEYNLARDLLVKALNLDGLHPRIYFSFALLFWDTGVSLLVHRACNLGLLALKQSPLSDRRAVNSYWSLIFNALIAEEQQENQKALKMYSDAMILNDYDAREDDHFIALFHFGYVCMMENRFPQAIKSFKSAKKKNVPEYMVALCLNNIGFAFANVGNEVSGIKYYSKGLETYPSFPLLLQNRMESYITLGKYLKALTDGDKLIQLATEHCSRRDLAYYHVTLSYIHWLLSSHTRHSSPVQCWNHAKEAFRLDPDLPEAHLMLSKLRHELQHDEVDEDEEQPLPEDACAETLEVMIEWSLKKHDPSRTEHVVELLKMKEADLRFDGKLDEAQDVEKLIVSYQHSTPRCF